MTDKADMTLREFLESNGLQIAGTGLRTAGVRAVVCGKGADGRELSDETTDVTCRRMIATPEGMLFELHAQLTASAAMSEITGRFETVFGVQLGRCDLGELKVIAGDCFVMKYEARGRPG
jgi:hypothetical protein